ncbi:MAG: hypothetical protein V8S72_04325 [Oscillospiraceae bacterium]
MFALILFLLPDWLAATYLENPDAAPGIRAMAPAILLVCLVSAYRGYCQGNGNMIPTTVDEVLEVLFKVISGLILASVAMKQGLGRPTASAGAILGVSMARSCRCCTWCFTSAATTTGSPSPIPPEYTIRTTLRTTMSSSIPRAR